MPRKKGSKNKPKIKKEVIEKTTTEMTQTAQIGKEQGIGPKPGRVENEVP